VVTTTAAGARTADNPQREVVNLQEVIKKTLDEIPPSRTDWTNSVFQSVKTAGKNSVGGFGEHLFRDWSESEGNNARIVRKGHDVLSGTEKVEVKTAFKSKAGSYFFNQIYYTHPETGAQKDWDHLVFVFVSPTGVEMWKCEKPPEPQKYFRRNNGWSWNRNSPSKLDNSIWKQIYTDGNL
jgi:hypothetical protein|tara:strand:- start:1218 stop:1760 length:543 start_codon:yes stop_codon:yes gene_type:complete